MYRVQRTGRAGGLTASRRSRTCAGTEAGRGIRCRAAYGAAVCGEVAYPRHGGRVSGGTHREGGEVVETLDDTDREARGELGKQLLPRRPHDEFGRDHHRGARALSEREGGGGGGGRALGRARLGGLGGGGASRLDAGADEANRDDRLSGAEGIGVDPAGELGGARGARLEERGVVW